ncbi:ribosomal protein L29 [Peptoclostridium acidaminophilum DSM 3953]|uniref:Large ribosomal subunit protein uL29 n=1 Tax=Peptoclostridium acidaminophilum DSM 3953 TaxID=1286171 RepID=W8TCG4_PEPAC|nr:50S ribosomal protein L29 [Peptoclostridium acidaminophilum]AHM55498.1 ribosomal protein L29 [Peptoclostridium acidaminophilum DSM 3953]
MKAKDLKEMTTQELSGKLNELKGELFNIRFQLATGQLENPMKIKFVKKDIARVQTVIREREINEARA